MKTRLSLAVALALGSGALIAADYTDIAPVISATPIVERVIEPRQECTTDRAAAPQQPEDRSLVGPIVGGIAGGVLGAQVGRGSGRTAAAAAGAIAGAVIGDRVDNRPGAAPQPVQRCRTVEMTREVVRGYTVVYRYNGRDIATTMPYNPGQTIRVAVSAIDGTGHNAAAPSANMMGGNVRDAGQPAPPAHPPAATPASSGNYTYR